MNQASILELVFGSAAIIVVSYLTGKLFRRLMSALARRSGPNSDIVRELGRAVQGAVLLIGVVAVAQYTGFGSELELLTIVGIVGLGLTLFLEGLLSEVISAYVLISEDLLRVNDQVTIRDVKGRILRITARCTYIKTDGGDLVVVGNSFLHRGPLVNFTAKERLKDKAWFTEKT